MLKIETLVYSI